METSTRFSQKQMKAYREFQYSQESQQNERDLGTELNEITKPVEGTLALAFHNSLERR